MKNPYLFALIILMSCSKTPKTFEDIDLQGHRGARGLMPENTIPGFIHAIDLGVNTLEMDLAITADSQVLVSHEPYMNAEIAIDSNNYRFPDEDAMKYNIYKMTYEQVAKFDVGLRIHPRFPEQKKMAVSKPLLKDVIDAVESYLTDKSLPLVNYNLEIKSREDADNIYHPSVPKFSNLVYDLVNENLDWSRVTIQSFDFRVLQYFNNNYPNVTLALLIENDLYWNENIDSLGFMPEIYSCDYMLLSSEVVKELQNAGMKVIPWTVNERPDMDRLLEWGVDGIITDYPNRTK